MGSHSLLIKKDGCAEHRETITIAEGEKKVVAGALSANPSPDSSGKIPAKGTNAYRYYEKAITGDAEAQSNLAWCYYKGESVTQDYYEAVKWFRKAAEQGDAFAQFYLGYCYKYGYGVTKDYAEAVKWWRKAAEQGDDVAQCNLGMCYNYGEGVTTSITEAVKWYRKAAAQGNVFATEQLKVLGYSK